ncbi:MAG TPA: hypothetical protein VMU85_21290 [Stellaceae bacterium]|nr:hypothetical protein [Stellaceae bacterium]
MGVLRTLARELVALFVDDGSLAASALLWVAACALALRLGLPAGWVGAALAAGLAAILLENALRAASRKS